MTVNKDEQSRSLRPALRAYLLAAFALTMWLGLSNGVMAQGQWTTNGNNINNTNTGNVGIGTTTPGSKLDLQAGSLNTGSSALNVGGTLNGPTGNLFGELHLFSINSGTPTNITGGYFQLDGSYTGTTYTQVLRGANVVPGTSTAFGFGNLGVFGTSQGTTTGNNIGVSGLAENGNLNYSFFGRSTTSKNSATNIGVAGFGLNSGASATQVGGYFGLQNGLPTYTSAALIADNGQTSDPVFLGRVNGTVKFILNASGNVGIGTASPVEKLEVAGTFKATERIAIGPGGGINQPFFGSTATVRSLLDARETITDLTTASNYAGLVPTLILNPVADSNSSVYGLNTTLATASGNTRNFGYLWGTQQYVLHQGTGTVSGVIGNRAYIVNGSTGTLSAAQALDGVVQNVTTGTITYAVGVNGSVGNIWGGTISEARGGSFKVYTQGGTLTNGYGVRILSATNYGGTFVNNYGLHIGDQSAVGSTNSFNIYSDGANSKNFFAGNVGIGTISPTAKLDVAGQIRSSTGGFKFPDGTVQTTAAVSGGGTITGVTAGAGLTGGGTSGNVTLTNDDRGSSQSIFKNIANGAGATQFSAGSNNDALSFEGTGGTTVSFNAATKKIIINSSASGPTSAADVSAGQFGQNTGGGNFSFPGDVTVAGNIAAKYQDIAEWVPSRQKLAAGTVVVLDIEQSNQVTASNRAYDTKVAGVVSAQPGVILGEAGENKAMVATTGRVKVKVDATRSPIKVGDLLVTSEQEGVAMKSEPVNISGVQFHRPGTIIGKALEPLAKGSGEILVLLSLQ